MSLNAIVASLSISSATSRLSKTWVECREHVKSSFSTLQMCLNLPLQDGTSLEKTHTIQYRWKRHPFVLSQFVHGTTTPGDQDHCPLPSIIRRMNGHFPLPALALQVGNTLTSNAGTQSLTQKEKSDFPRLPGHSVYLHRPDGKCLLLSPIEPHFQQHSIPVKIHEKETYFLSALYPGTQLFYHYALKHLAKNINIQP